MTPELDAERRLLELEHSDLLREHEELRKNPGDRLGHQMHLHKLHEHTMRLHAYAQRLHESHQK